MFTRYNSMGLKYVIFEENGKTRIVQGKNNITVEQSLETISGCWYMWTMRGKPVQEAFSCLNADEREFIMTGITPEKWNEIFKETE